MSEKGQVTIPKALRDSLAIGPGTELDFVEEDGKLVARRVMPSDPLSNLVGLLAPTDVDAVITQMRGPRWSKKLDAGADGHRRR